MNLIFRARAQNDIRDAYLWYQQEAALGADFLVEVERTQRLISDNPELFQCVRGNTRRALLRRFPYALFYLVGSRHISVLFQPQ